MSQDEGFSSWFERHWPKSLVPVAVGFMVVLPVVFSGLSAATFFAILFIPLVLLHQYEEHAGDRGRSFVNRLAGPPSPAAAALTPRLMLLFAALGVWLPAFATPILTSFGAAALIAVAAVVAGVEVVLHLIGWVLSGRPSPGMRTALILLVPFSVLAFGAAQTAGAVEAHYLAALLVALAPRIAALGIVLGRRSRLIAQAA